MDSVTFFMWSGKSYKRHPSENFFCHQKMFMKVVQDDEFVSSYVCSYFGISILCIYDHGKVFRINGKIFFQNLTKDTPPSKFFFKWKEKLGRRGVFCKILKENFSIHSGNFSMIINTPNIYPIVRTNIGGHKSIILDHFHEHFLMTKNVSEGCLL